MQRYTGFAEGDGSWIDFAGADVSRPPRPGRMIFEAPGIALRVLLMGHPVVVDGIGKFVAAHGTNNAANRASDKQARARLHTQDGAHACAEHSSANSANIARGVASDFCIGSGAVALGIQSRGVSCRSAQVVHRRRRSYDTQPTDRA
ncbi:hypothetical protein DZD52_12120 [Xanthomonas nasturtii]|uniref:Uncharacterized protein n=1 Tax=Xanthomonas nasturtii TaxID=1843581 RepID=A0A3E1KIY5_9XANT|nr:hypothetical protein DZD52_12120 [Xanthomonas nasturtii]